MAGADAADTILAVSSPPGAGAVSIVRLSGSEALSSVASLAGPDGPRLLGLHGFSETLVNLDLDRLSLPVRIAVYRAPRSYTGEDALEIVLPGSEPLLGILTRRLLRPDSTGRSRLRWAGPGEFTQRAFQSGRIDLAEAESVAALISATGEAEARASRRGLRGELSASIRGLREGVLECLALIEAALDFPDEELPQLSPESLLERLRTLEGNLGRLRASTALRAPGPTSIRVVLAGFPNAGKSSLFNALLGRPLALTSSVPGTTRDPLRGGMTFEGQRLEWTDLAGTLDTARWVFGGESENESEIWDSVRRLTRLEVESSDVAVWVLDPASDVGASLRARDQLQAPLVVTVIQKADLTIAASVRDALLRAAPGALWVSAQRRSGLEELLRRVLNAVRDRPRSAYSGRAEPSFIVSAHQELALERTGAAISRASAALSTALGFEWVAVDLRDALSALDEILGAARREEVLDWVFARFCLGK